MPGETRKYNGEGIFDKMGDELSNIIDKVEHDLGKASAWRQLTFGVTSGCVTGFALMKIGRVAAVTIGGGVLLLQVANYNGYININWDKVTKKAEEISEKVEDSMGDKKPSVLKKVERYVDKKLDKIENVEKKVKSKILKSLNGGDDQFVVKEVQVFTFAFVGGFLLGAIIGILFRVIFD